MNQKYTSKDTSINVINKVYKKYEFKENSLILDYGGGKYDSNVIYMKNKNNSIVLVYDKYNKDIEHNKKVLDYCRKNIPNYVVCSNVLNVIMEDEIINEICTDILNYCNNETIVIFAIYECDKSGIGKETSKGYQRNEKTKEYLKFIEKYYKINSVKSGIIICQKKEEIL
jgi:hypothetical protein